MLASSLIEVAVYKATVRMLIRRSIRMLNEGRYRPALSMLARDAMLTFPAHKAFSHQHRTPQRSRGAFPTHERGDEVESFLRNYVSRGIQMEVEDILVNGPPWDTRAAVRVHHRIRGADGEDLYGNRAVLMARVRWGKISS